MPAFSKASATKLATCDERLQKVMNEVIKYTDITILHGHRTPEQQAKLYAKGRKLVNGKWVKVGKTVTDKDGTVRKSKHNYYPSKAVDIAPYPVNWRDIKGFVDLHDIVDREAKKLGITLVWGADWDSDGDIREHSLQDYPHYEVS